MLRSSSLSSSRRAFGIRPRSLAMGSSQLSRAVYSAGEMGPTTRIAGWLAALVVAAGCLTPAADREAPSHEPARAARVVDHGSHTAIVVRRADVDPAIWPEVNDFPQAALVEIAWGDRDFYMTAEATASLAVKAALFSSGSVLHVAGLAESALSGIPAGDVVELGISGPGFDRMTGFVHDEYRRDGEGGSVRLGRGLEGGSWFYAARSRYHLFNTCNTWVTRALQHAGLDVSPAGVMTAGNVMQQVRRLAVAP